MNVYYLTGWTSYNTQITALTFYLDEVLEQLTIAKKTVAKVPALKNTFARLLKTSNK